MPNAENLIPTQFKPGQSGNPNGRPKGSRNFKTILEEMLSFSSDVTGPNGKLFSRHELLCWRLIQHATTATKEESQIKATIEIMDRVDGKAKVFTENTTTEVQISHDDWVKRMNNEGVNDE